MHNFGEIRISENGSAKSRQPSDPEQKRAPENPNRQEAKEANRENLRQQAILCITQFDEAHRNKDLDFEEKMKLYQKIFIALSVATLSMLADQSGNIETPREKKQVESKLPADTDISFSEEKPKSENELVDLEKIRKHIQISYQNESQEKEIPKIKPKGKKIKPPAPDTEKESSAEKALHIAIQIQALSRNILKNDEFFPKKIFSQDFLLCIQAQESSFKKDALSPVGAAGSMQVMPDTVRDIINYINKIDSRVNFKKEDLSDETINEIVKLIRQNYNLGEAFGKLYLAQIFNGFGIGQKSLENNWITLGRKKILAVYNWGIGNFSKNPTNEESWPKETKDYIEKIFSDLETLQGINARLNIDGDNQKIRKSNKKEIASKFKTHPQAIKKALVLEMRKFKNKQPEEIAAILNYYLGEIHIQEKIKKDPLQEDELKKIARQLRVINPQLWASN